MKIRSLLTLGLCLKAMITMHTASAMYGNTEMRIIINNLQAILAKTNGLVTGLSEALVNVNGTGDNLASLITNLMQEASTSINAAANQINAVSGQLDIHTQDVMETLAIVQQSSILLSQIVQTVNDNHQGNCATRSQVDAIYEQLADADSELFYAIEFVGNQVDDLYTAVDAGGERLNKKIKKLSHKLTDCCTELSEQDAKIFSAIENVDTDLGFLGTTVILGDSLLNTKIRELSHKVTAGYAELSEQDAKIFSVIEKIESSLATAHTPSEPTPSRNQVHFIKNKHLQRADGLVITEPGLYILTESLTIDNFFGITITAENVTLDLNKFSITAFNDDASPLTIALSDTICIKNGTIIGGQGISIDTASGIMLENLIVTYPISTGIQMSNVQGATIERCAVRNGAQAGISADTGSAEITIRNTSVSDCWSNGFDLQAQGLLIQDSVAHDNDGTGITIANSINTHLQRAIVDSNSGNGICIDNSVERVHVESCRIMGNGGIGCVDNGATLATWMNNLASGNLQDDYQNIKAVLASKATSFWHNVYGN